MYIFIYIVSNLLWDRCSPLIIRCICICIILGAGFDGVQIHSANGYLIDEFLQGVTNRRTDEYGGSIENRLRFMKEVIESVLTVCKPEQTWIRFSPNGAFQEMGGRPICKKN